MKEYMPFQQGQFDDIMPGLAIVEYYLEGRKALDELHIAESKNEQAKREHAVSGERIRDLIYTDCIAKIKEHVAPDPEALMAYLIGEYRKAACSPNELGRADLLHHIACKAVLPFCKFDEEAFNKACEKALEGSKDLSKKYNNTRSELSNKKKVWEEAISKYKVGIFKEHSMVFMGNDGRPEDRAWDRSTEFERVWRYRASMHSAPVTIECTDIRSYPNEGPLGDVKKRWAACYKLLDLKPAVGEGFIARKYA